MIKTKMYSFRMPIRLINFLSNKKNKSKFIVQAIDEKIDRLTIGAEEVLIEKYKGFYIVELFRLDPIRGEYEILSYRAKKGEYLSKRYKTLKELKEIIAKKQLTN